MIELFQGISIPEDIIITELPFVVIGNIALIISIYYLVRAYRFIKEGGSIVSFPFFKKVFIILLSCVIALIIRFLSWVFFGSVDGPIYFTDTGYLLFHFGGFLLISSIILLFIGIIKIIRGEWKENNIILKNIIPGLIMIIISPIIMYTNISDPSQFAIYQTCVSAPYSVGCKACQWDNDFDGGGIIDEFDTLKFNDELEDLKSDQYQAELAEPNSNNPEEGVTNEELCSACEYGYFKLSRDDSAEIGVDEDFERLCRYQTCNSAPNSVGCEACQGDNDFDGEGIIDEFETLKFSLELEDVRSDQYQAELAEPNSDNPEEGVTNVELCSACEYGYFKISRDNSAEIGEDEDFERLCK
jgi:hypothetical protein